MTPSRSIRLAVLDDGLFVRTYAGEVRPLSATFNQFVEAVARTGAFERVRYIVPVRHLRIWEIEPSLDPVDESLVEVVPTTFFSGIADYLLRAPYVAARNWSVIDKAVAGSDLLWLRLPASNAALALAAARRHRVAHFGWVAGSVRDVAAAQPRVLPLSAAARLVGDGYDAVTSIVGRTGPLIRLDAELFASVVTDADVAQTRLTHESAAMEPAGRLPRIVWAGRMANEKGLDDLIEALGMLRDAGHDSVLVLVGDGPARRSVERALARLPADRVEDYGYVGHRPLYMELLRGGDVLAHPSRAEGVPKVVVEAMAAGLPVVAADTGALRALLADGARGRLVPPGDPRALATALESLLADASERATLREAALEWAAAHTAEAQAARLLDRLRALFPQLDWAEQPSR